MLQTPKGVGEKDEELKDARGDEKRNEVERKKRKGEALERTRIMKTKQMYEEVNKEGCQGDER